MATDLIGTKLDRYFLLSRIGSGGSAAVYRAHDAQGDRYVAVKILPLHLAANDDLYRRFMREAQMAARLDHPHILPVYDYGESAGMPYIVMKLVEGGTLDSFVREGALPLPFVSRVLAVIAGALDYAHSQGVIHRDLKPENILFDAEGTLYLGDFGVAHLNEGTDVVTGRGGFIGTVAYASPEQCRGEALTASSDIYSLGVMLFEMLTGRLPFTGPTPLAVMHQHLSEPAPSPLRYRPDLPLAVADVLRKALAKLPSVRFQSAGALSAAFDDALGELHLSARLATLPPPGPNPVFEHPPDPGAAPLPIPEDLLRAFTPPPSTAVPALNNALPPLDALPAPPGQTVFRIWVLLFMIGAVLIAALVILIAG